MTFFVTINIFLYIAYYIVSFFYIISGVVLLMRPNIIKKLIPRFFPLLASLNRGRIENGLNLVVVGLGLFLIGDLLLKFSFFGFYTALVLSLWEVYLSIAFYLREHTIFDAVSHFFIHIALVIVIGWVLITYYSTDISNLAKIINIENKDSNNYVANFLGTSITSIIPKNR